MMYKTRLMKRSVWLALSLILSFCFSSYAQTSAPAAPEKQGFAARSAGLEKKDGFFPYLWDEKKGEVLFELSPAALDREFLYFTALGSGIGSTEMFADRSSFGNSVLCRFRRVGMRVLVIEENTSFRAVTGSPDLKHSVDLSF